MTKLLAKTKVRIWGHKNAWSLSQSSGYSGPATECDIELEIDGDENDGYHFIMAPEGFFVADTWHETIDEALEQGKENFGIDFSEWKQS